MKILVVGAGIAGPALCYWLKLFGFEPTLVEKNKGLRKGGYAIDIRGVAVDVAKKMGLYEKICSLRTKIISGRYVDAKGNTIHEEEGEALGVRQGEDVEIARGLLIEVLMQNIKDIPCYFDANIIDLRQHDKAVEVLFEDGKRASYDLVIGADGLHSSVRGLTFSTKEYSYFDLGFFISVFSIPNYLNLNHSSILFETSSSVTHVSSDHDAQKALAGFMFRSSHTLKDLNDDSEQKKFLWQTFKDKGWESNKFLELMDKSQDFYFDSITQVKMDTWFKGRIALLGDAGYCASPLSGQGTSLALVGAYILAGELKKANGDYESAFAKYNKLLQSFVKSNQNFGQWASEVYLAGDTISKDSAQERMKVLLEQMRIAANAIKLPEY